MRGRGLILVLGLALVACASTSPSGTSATPDEHVQVSDETGWLVSSTFVPGDVAAEPSPPRDPLRNRIFNPVGSPTELVVVWFTGVCLYDRSVTLIGVDQGLRIELYRGTPISLASSEVCPAAGALYTLQLTFNREMPAANVDLQIGGSE